MGPILIQKVLSSCGPLGQCVISRPCKASVLTPPRPPPPPPSAFRPGFRFASVDRTPTVGLALPRQPPDPWAGGHSPTRDRVSVAHVTPVHCLPCACVSVCRVTVGRGPSLGSSPLPGSHPQAVREGPCRRALWGWVTMGFRGRPSEKRSQNPRRPENAQGGRGLGV